MAGLGDVAGLLKQAQKMQQEMGRAQEELKTQIVEGTSGGGAVTVRFSGAMEILSIKLDPKAVDPAEVEVLEDLIQMAVKVGIEKARELSKAHLGRLTGGLTLPGIQ